MLLNTLQFNAVQIVTEALEAIQRAQKLPRGASLSGKSMV